MTIFAKSLKCKHIITRGIYKDERCGFPIDENDIYSSLCFYHVKYHDDTFIRKRSLRIANDFSDKLHNIKVNIMKRRRSLFTCGVLNEEN